MKTKFALLLVFCAVSLNIFAQEKKIKDRRTNPELYYLEESEVANSLELLPPPPEAGSILFLYDKARYDWGKLQVSFIGFGTSASLQPVKQNKANIKRKYRLFFIFNFTHLSDID